MRRWLMAMMVVAAIIAGGCGGSSQQGPFGALSEDDIAQMKAISASFREIVDENIEITAALNDEDIDGAQIAVDSFGGMLGDMRMEILKLDNGELQDALNEYLDPLDDLADGYQRLLNYADQPWLADPNIEYEILSDIQRAYRAAQKADRKLMRHLTSVLSDDQREQMTDWIEDYTDDYNQRMDEALSP